MDKVPTIDLSRVADELGLRTEQVAGVASLLDEGNTVPFITRYRKERTGNLDEVQIRRIEQRIDLLRQFASRAATILRLIDAQGKLTPALETAIEQADTLKRLDDLYLPFRPKRTSRASKARGRGLEPLADQVWNGDRSLGLLELATCKFVDPSNQLPSSSDVLQGVVDILSERISESAGVRDRVRTLAWKTGRLAVSATKAAKETGQDYRDYFDYNEAIARVPLHRVLAVNRGENAAALRVRFNCDRSRIEAAVVSYLDLHRRPAREFLKRCVRDALSRHILPSLQREFRREITERAESHAVDVFAENLRHLLLQPPLRNERVLAVDPGFRTGCKVAALDEYGNLLAHDVIYVTGSQEKRATNRQKLVRLLEQYNCRLIAIGNGTACRETEELIAEIIYHEQPNVRYAIVNEAGASIYSTSATAAEEFPDLDATVRGTISIGRRLQDPLSEQVKIDPQHLGVGLYQHDVNPKRLKESLDQVVESCVNYVGVDLNTASASLLRHVSGFNQRIAWQVVQWRMQNGRFTDRRQLLEVSGLGRSTFKQAAGFLKIIDGEEPLDGTSIHPESYSAAKKMLGRLSAPANGSHFDWSTLRPQLAELNADRLATDLCIGAPTCRDIIEALLRPGRDPRADLPGPMFKQGILKLDDLTVGLELTGSVLNVVDFGAFVDIGLKESGLVHISQLSTSYVRFPFELVAIGDVITVWVLSVDHERHRVSLTMINPETDRNA